MEESAAFARIVENVNGKCAHKVRVQQNAVRSFEVLRKEGEQLVGRVVAERQAASEAAVVFHDLGKMQFQMDFGEDALIFNLHEDVFDLDPGHPVRKTSYLKDDPSRGFCAMVSIYNFLTSSVGKDRADDIGYLIGRIFINADNHFFVEGKKQLGFLYSSFDTQELRPEMMREVMMASVLHCMDSDLEVPPFEMFAALNVMQIQAINGTLGTQPARPLGFHFSKTVNNDE
ncbi:MAG: hypothetical protein K9J06_11845 [Flavobacteriales bacterium]|nr:hypothetical protein [Flavobacteriales bacterium]